VCDALGDAPDLHVLPVGNAGNIAAYWKGYQEYAKDKLATRTPHMWGFQAEGAAPIVRGAIVEKPDTAATAIRVGNPASWTLAEAARDESGGRIEMVTDEQILTAQRELAAREGVFVEPASAAGVAGLLHAKAQGWLPGGSTVVITVTGHGLKDVDTALDHSTVDESPVTPPDTDAVARVAGLA
jgi:threonine synthase